MSFPLGRRLILLAVSASLTFHPASSVPFKCDGSIPTSIQRSALNIRSIFTSRNHKERYPAKVRHTFKTSTSQRVGIFKRWTHRRFVEATDMKKLVQSFSGVRGVMQKGHLPILNHFYLKAMSFYAYLYALNRIDTVGPRRAGMPLQLLIARDPRPSSEAIRDAILRGYRAAAQARGVVIEPVDLGVLTTPIAESAVRTLQADGGIIITGSHNPLKANGIKTMTAWDDTEGWLGKGSLISASTMKSLITAFQQTRQNPVRYFSMLKAVWQQPLSQNDIDHAQLPSEWIQRILDGYIVDLRKLFPGVPINDILIHFKGILVDTNGGAGAARRRHHSNDGLIKWVLRQFVPRVESFGDELGKPEHGIEPKEGSDGLSLMDKRLADLGFPLGGVFDFDCDRVTTAPQMEPQEVAAFNVAMMLSMAVAYNWHQGKKLVVVEHCATSMRVRAIVELFRAAGYNVELRRVETGEVNLVAAMNEERNNGNYPVIGVEGANGGTILNGSTSRDGINTLLLTAIALEDPRTQAAWVRVRKPPNPVPTRWTLKKLSATLPPRSGKLWSEKDLPIEAPALKSALENRLKEVWSSQQALGVYDHFTVRHYYETGEFLDQQDGIGGWAVYLHRRDGGLPDLLWLRPSGTESLVRLEVDAADDAQCAALEAVYRSLFDQIMQEHRPPQNPSSRWKNWFSVRRHSTKIAA